jgi:hypothetical protein
METPSPTNKKFLDKDLNEKEAKSAYETTSEKDDGEDDAALLSKFGFTDIERRLKGELDVDDDELLGEIGLPSSRGVGAVLAEYGRMGITWDD